MNDSALKVCKPKKLKKIKEKNQETTCEKQKKRTDVYYDARWMVL